MFSESELLIAIDELENSPTKFQDVEKLATFYILYDHLYKKPEPMVETVKEVKINRYDGSEFLRVISGKKPCDVWRIMDDFMGMVKVTNPQIYRAIIHRISKL